MQVTEWIIPTVYYLYCCSTWDSSQGPAAVQTQEKLFTVSAALTEDQSVLQMEENEAAIHQSLAIIQKLTLKIVLPHLTYLSPVCVQVMSAQFTGTNKI